ncbi:MAG: amidohydrolase family protein [Terriglobia bacterium]
MKKFAFLLVLAIAAGACSKHPAGKSSPSTSSSATPVTGHFSDSELQAFAALEPIDTHTHVFQSDPAFYAMLQKLHMHILDICVDNDHSKVERDLPAEIKDALEVVHASDGDAALCTTFDPYKYRDRGFAPAAIRQINHNFDEGAIAVKIWKNIGMEIKDAKGNYILPNDPVFEPIYKDIAAHHKTLVAHVADPNTSWEPPNPRSPDYSYYKEHPEWYMYKKPLPASKEEILRARDRLLEQNPDLRVVGAHLGSMEADFNQLAQHLDRYSNFAVDIAGRVPYLMMQPRAGMIAFITQYQDRLLYATDLDFPPGADAQATVKDWENHYARDWRFFATKDALEYQGRKVQGLDLPQDVLRKLYHDNAVHWFPGILGGSH